MARKNKVEIRSGMIADFEKYIALLNDDALWVLATVAKETLDQRAEIKVLASIAARREAANKAFIANGGTFPEPVER